MKRKKAVGLLALILALTLTLSGCYFQLTLPPIPSAVPTAPTAAPTEPVAGSTEATAPTAPPIDPDDPALVRWQNGGMRDYLPDEALTMVPFGEMAYRRPDTETLYADFDALTDRAKTETDAEALLEDYYEVYSRYVSFYSMDTLANIRYSQNTQDSYYKSEYDFCEAEGPNLEEKLEALYKAFAASPCRKDLEAAYFGEGYFLTYDDYEVYTNETYLRLSQEEAAVLSEYRDLTADPQVTYKGKTVSLSELLETDNYSDYIGGLRAYYDQYNPKIGALFLRLVKIRRQLADALDYDTYAEYSYEITYSRDYTPDQGEDFLEGIKEHLVPILAEAGAAGKYGGGASYLSTSESKVMNMVRSAAQVLGGTVWDAFRFMEAYSLCDIARAPEKVESSFQTYIYDYEAPFVLVNAQHDGTDYTTFAHEFGHFTDAYYNYGADEDLETAETFSQAMEFLALCYSETLTDRERSVMLENQLLDALDTFVYQGAYASFEARVYALDPEELTLDRVNEIYAQCCREFGVYEPMFDFYYSQGWIDIIHFFEVPYYIISYCVSAETALEVYELEAEQSGEGVKAYFRLLDRPYEAGVQAVMEAADLGNPFREEVLEQTADFFRGALGLN